MINVHDRVKPFHSLPTCGDFSVVIERQDGHLVAVGDVGGHGLQAVGELARVLKQTIENSAEMTLENVFTEICAVKELNEFGMTLFLGFFDKHLPVLSYYCVGDVKLSLHRADNTIKLDKQNGMLGLNTPNKIERFAIKLHDKDLLFVATDGVSRDYLKVIASQGITVPLQQLNEHIMAQATNGADDALSMCILFKQVNNKHVAQTSIAPKVPIKQPVPATESQLIDDWVEPKIAAQHTTLPTDSPEPMAEFVVTKDTFVLPYHDQVEAANLLCKVERSAARTKLSAICSYLGITGNFNVKLQTFLFEILNHSATSLQVYVKQSYLKVHFCAALKFVKSSADVLGRQYLFCAQASEQYWLSVPFDSDIDTHTEQFEQFKEQLQLGIDDHHYQQFLEDKRRDSVLAQHAKLASMGEMIGSIAHQWRQPLNELAIRIQTLEYQVKQAEDLDALMAQFVQDSMNTITFMSKTIDDFRNFFRVDKKKQTFCLRDAVEQVLSMQQAQMDSHGIQVKVEGRPIEIESYKSEIQQVLLNLISNAKDAFKASQVDNKLIKIALERGTVRVQDNAGGVPDSIAPRIFEPYFTTKPHGEGTGMGLYMSKLIANESLHGDLIFKNTTSELGQGACFSLTVPTKSKADVR